MFDGLRGVLPVRRCHLYLQEGGGEVSVRHLVGKRGRHEADSGVRWVATDVSGLWVATQLTDGSVIYSKDGGANWESWK